MRPSPERRSRAASPCTWAIRRSKCGAPLTHVSSRCDTIRAGAPHLFANGDLGWYDHAPGGEGLAALAARTGAFLDDLAGPAVIVTHGINSRVMRTLALGKALSAFGQLPGGQGVVHHIRGSSARVIG